VIQGQKSKIASSACVNLPPEHFPRAYVRQIFPVAVVSGSERQKHHADLLWSLVHGPARNKRRHQPNSSPAQEAFGPVYFTGRGSRSPQPMNTHQAMYDAARSRCDVQLAAMLRCRTGEARRCREGLSEGPKGLINQGGSGEWR
jgi:hypothetical protein